MSKVQLTLEAASPGGRVRKRAYDAATTPPDESAADRAKRKGANRSSALRARTALVQMLTEEPPPATAPPMALELVPPSTEQKRSRHRMPGVRRGSKLAKKSLLERSLRQGRLRADRAAHAARAGAEAAGVPTAYAREGALLWRRSKPRAQVRRAALRV